jgi:hypothetical protein
MAPEPVTDKVPALDSVVTLIVPPVFNVPVEEFVNVPAPESAVLTVNVPLFVYVPVTATDGILVVVEPLIVFEVPEKVCTPVLAVNVVALFVREPAMA